MNPTPNTPRQTGKPPVGKPPVGKPPVGKPLSVLATGQQSPRAQRARRYLPETTAHPTRMQPALARHLIETLTQPGQLVADPMCGAGTTLVEALHAGRHAVGIDIEPRWASLARDNITHTAHQGVAAHAAVITADARRLPDVLAPDYTAAMAGRVSLVLTSPPYGLHTHGIARTHPTRGVVKRHHRYSPTIHAANLAYQPLHRLLAGLTRILAGCIPLLAPGAHVVLTTRPWRSHGELIDFPGLVTQAAIDAGLAPVQRCVALLAGLRDGQLVTRASFFQRHHVAAGRAAGLPWHLIVHEDVLIFRAHRTSRSAEKPTHVHTAVGRPPAANPWVSADAGSAA